VLSISSQDDVENIEHSDLQLWEEFKAGNENAFARIYQINAPKLYSYGLKLVHDKDLVKDCIQDLFIEIWDKKDRLGRVKSIKSYLYKSIRRKILKQASNQNRLNNISCTLESINEISQSTEVSLLEKQRLDEDRKALANALNQLNNKQREIIHLKYYARLSYEDIAEVMSLDIKATYNLMAYTIKILRQNITSLSLLLLNFFI